MRYVNPNGQVVVEEAGEHEVTRRHHGLAAQVARRLSHPPGVPGTLTRVVEEEHLGRLAVYRLSPAETKGGVAEPR